MCGDSASGTVKGGTLPALRLGLTIRTPRTLPERLRDGVSEPVPKDADKITEEQTERNAVDAREVLKRGKVEMCRYCTCVFYKHVSVACGRCTRKADLGDLKGTL